MKRYTLRSTHLNPNFVIQNIVENPINSDLLPVLYDLLNILHDNSIAKRFNAEKENEVILMYLTHDRTQNLYKSDKTISEVELDKRLCHTSISRLQIFLLELLINNYINLQGVWQFNVLLQNECESEIFENITYRNEFYGLVQVMGINALEHAIIDLLNLLEQSSQSKINIKIEKPTFNIRITINKAEFIPTNNEINLDFSILKGYTDEGKLNPAVIYIRNDHFEEPINFNYRDN